MEISPRTNSLLNGSRVNHASIGLSLHWLTGFTGLDFFEGSKGWRGVAKCVGWKKGFEDSRTHVLRVGISYRQRESLVHRKKLVLLR